MNTNNPLNTDPAHGAPNGTPPAHGANSGSHGDQSPTSKPTIEELQRQLAASEAKNAEFLADNQKYRKKQQELAEANKAKEALEKAAEEQLLQEQNQHKELAELRQAEIDKLLAEIAQRDSEIAKRDYEALRAKIATKHGLAPELAIRLVGTIEEELDKDAAALKKITGESSTAQPGNRPNPRPASGTSQRTTEQIAEKQRATGPYTRF